MELQPEAIAGGESLVPYLPARTEQFSAVRDGKRIAMELEDMEFFRESRNDSRAFRYFCNLVPAGLGNGMIYRCSERGRNELGAKADTENFLPVLCGFPDEIFLLLQVREFTFIVHAHRPAHEHEVGGVRAGDFAGIAEPDIFEGNVVSGKDLFEIPEGFGGFVLEYRDLHVLLRDVGWYSR